MTIKFKIPRGLHMVTGAHSAEEGKEEERKCFMRNYKMNEIRIVEVIIS
jgi:hypothetical protein